MFSAAVYLYRRQRKRDNKPFVSIWTRCPPCLRSCLPSKEFRHLFCYVTLLLFRYSISIMIMTLLCPIMTLLYHLFFCKCPDYYFSLFHYLQKDYYFTYDTSIISLIFFVIYYCYYCYYDTIICIIFIANYYHNYFIRKVLWYQLFVFAPII